MPEYYKYIRIYIYISRCLNPLGFTCIRLSVRTPAAAAQLGPAADALPLRARLTTVSSSGMCALLSAVVSSTSKGIPSLCEIRLITSFGKFD